MKDQYPNTFEEIPEWAKENKLPLREARRRFAQLLVLRAIALSNVLSRDLVLKGGIALDFVWQPNRSTIDIDFSFDHKNSKEIDIDKIIKSLSSSLSKIRTETGVFLRVQSHKQKPAGEARTFATFEIKVGFAFVDEKTLTALIEREEPVPNTIPVEISKNEIISEDEKVNFGGSNFIRVATREDIIAEKLRSLLQQKIRNRNRRQDLLDVAILINEQAIDVEKVRKFLIEKTKGRDIDLKKESFRDSELKERALKDYQELEHTVRNRFIAFEDAYKILLDFVETLGID